MYYVYILQSLESGRFYVGSTNNLKDRISRHNSARNRATKSGIPWELIHSELFNTRSEAVQQENKIKKRGIKRYLIDKKILGT